MRRRILASLVFVGLFCGGFDASYLRVLAGDRAPLPNPDRHTLEYPPFLEGVARSTRPGDSIVVVVPMRYWRTGYRYAYYKASYVLAGRQVLSILDDHDRVHPERLQEADFVALWRLPELPGYEVVWRGHGGVLLRRVR